MCICRMRLTGDTTKTVFITRYVMLFTLFVASMLSIPLFNQETSLIQVLLGLGMVVDLALGVKAWRKVAPGYTTRATQ